MFLQQEPRTGLASPGASPLDRQLPTEQDPLPLGALRESGQVATLSHQEVVSGQWDAGPVLTGACGLAHRAGG